MRPERLEMEGFSTFRRRTVIDFAGAELFALTGPTGAGKSSVLDAIVFALYGSVPRHGRKDVSSVVTQGTIQARVLLEFSVSATAYTVARVVRKNGAGKANTDEARLESNGAVIASGAREVDEAVSGLLGLDYEQFTTCVVLPQGEFERFLHAKPADRQGLLVALLDLGVYERIAQLATGRQKYEEGRRTAIDTQLAAMPDAPPAARVAAADRVEQLTALLQRIDALQPDLDQLEVRAREALGRLEESDALLRRVAAIELPDGFEELAQRLDHVKARQDWAAAEVESARHAIGEAERELEGRSSEELQRSIERRARHTSLQARMETTASELEEAVSGAESADTRHGLAVEALDRSRRHDMALHLRRGLQTGDPCPVCERSVDHHLDTGDVAGLAGAEAEVQAAVRELERARAQATTVRTRLEELDRQLAEGAAGLAGVPGLDELERSLARVEETEGRLVAARQRLAAGEDAYAEATRSMESLAGRERETRRLLQQARDSVAALDPPVLDLLDVPGDWKLLMEWASTTLPAIEDRCSGLRGECERIRGASDELSDQLRAGAAALGLNSSGRPTRDVVVDALSSASAALAGLDEQLAKAASLRTEKGDADERSAVARELAVHLRANNFERWILDEAMRVLAIGANGRLAELARGQYSLALSDRLVFEIVDHHAADERRPVKSLSGGETFLVSLALALSLADHIAEMASGGTARLESIFLDEGFGTLDPETLETVAGVISEIGSTGKTVGLVTHVKELAEQAPIRFEVSKGSGGATVDRVEV